jgi:transmembrane sensor
MTSQHRKLEPDHILGPLEREAVFWYWKIQEPDLPRSEWLRFWEWNAIAEHRVAFDAMATVWESACNIPLDAPHASTVTVAPARRRLPRILARLVVVLLLLATIGPDIGPASRVFQTNDTAKAWVLDDGSIVRAAPDTRLEVTMSKEYRSSELRRGQAFFRVADDHARPFVVHTPATSVQAIGTRFGVTNDDGVSVVTVIEGTVSVSRGAQPSRTSMPAASSASTPLMTLNAGQQARVSSDAFYLVPRVDSKQALSWATTILFEGEAVGEAVKQFNRLSGIRLELSNAPGASAVSIVGDFLLDDPRMFAQVVANGTSAPVLLHRDSAATRDADPEIVLPQEPYELRPVVK